MPEAGRDGSEPGLLRAVVGAEGVRVTDGDAEAVARLHDRVGRWTLMAALHDHGLAVLEDLADLRGSLVYVGPDGVVAELTKTWEPTEAPEVAQEVPRLRVGVGPDAAPGRYLTGADDPDPSEIRAAVPPVRRLRDGEGERPYTFVGTPECSDVIPIYYDARRATHRVNPAVVAPEILPVIEEQRLAEGIVGGWLPTVRLGYPISETERWESLQFAAVDPPSDYQQTAWYRFLRIREGRVIEARYVDTYLPYPVGEAPDAASFYAALLDLRRYWIALLDGGMQVEVPDPELADFVRHSFALERITRVGDRPKYGVVDRIYGAPEHDGFQDILTTTAAAYLEWGRGDVAGGVLHQYFREFVRPDGTIRYRGPEIGQYARTLTMVAQHLEYTGDASVLDEHLEKIEAIAAILAARRTTGLRRPKGDPAYGMLPGRHEADISFDTATLGTADYEQPYLSNTAEAWRAHVDLGRVWSAYRSSARADVRTPCLDALAAGADGLRRDLLDAIDASRIERDGRAVLPIIAGSRVAHRDAPYRSCPESYDDNRVWHELLHSGALDEQHTMEIVEQCARLGDTTFGIPGNRKLLVGFMAHGIAHGLLQHDRVREFLMLFHAHRAHLHTRGTWTALECADLDRARGEHWPYCVPAQLTVPLLTRWMLVFTDAQDRSVWLARATPRAWLRPGQTIRVSGAPVGGATIDYTIVAAPDAAIVRVTVTLSDPLDVPLRLRLRVPLGRRLAGVEIDGVPYDAFDADTEVIDLPQDASIDLTARYAPAARASAALRRA